MSANPGQRSVLTVYAHIYGTCLKKTVKGLAKNPWTALLPMALMLFFALAAGVLVTALGMVGGFLIGFLVAALVSCYLYFLGEIVANGRLGLKDFATSIKAYFWSVMNLLFVVWIADMLVTPLIASGPNGALLAKLFNLFAIILFNAAPEVIYQRDTYGGLATFQRSMHFLQENWIEWGIPNLIGLALLYAFDHYLVLNPALFLTGMVGKALLGGAFLHAFFVFRGHLFQELDGTGHRQRMFKYRTAA